MLATKRTDRVRGRIILLTNSIRNKINLRIIGEPSGIRCIENPLKLLNMPKIINLNQIPNPK